MKQILVFVFSSRKVGNKFHQRFLVIYSFRFKLYHSSLFKLFKKDQVLLDRRKANLQKVLITKNLKKNIKKSRYISQFDSFPQPFILSISLMYNIVNPRWISEKPSYVAIENKNLRIKEYESISSNQRLRFKPGGVRTFLHRLGILV